MKHYNILIILPRNVEISDEKPFFVGFAKFRAHPDLESPDQSHRLERKVEVPVVNLAVVRVLEHQAEDDDVGSKLKLNPENDHEGGQELGEDVPSEQDSGQGRDS